MAADRMTRGARGAMRWLAGWALALVLAAGFAMLGRWQLARMHEKQQMLAAAQLGLRQQALPHSVQVAFDPARQKAYDWVAGRGELVAVTLWLDNQQHAGRVGMRMYCLWRPEGQARALLLDAGWWPWEGERRLPSAQCPAGRGQAVRGLLAPPPAIGLAHGPALLQQPDGRWLVMRMELPALAAALGQHTSLAPRVLRLDPERRADDAGVMALPEGERNLDILPNTLPPERHLGYAIQWFGLALATLVVAAVLSIRYKRQSFQRAASP